MEGAAGSGEGGGVSGYFCNKCGYAGNTMRHDRKDGMACNYYAGWVETPEEDDE
jgi:hypothetical protein